MMATDISKDLPVIDLDVFLAGPADSEAVIQECRKVSNIPFFVFRLNCITDPSIVIGI